MKLEVREPNLGVIRNNQDHSETVFSISGLSRGMASGYASSLRMVLLEHIPGLKPIGFKLLGAQDLMEALPQHTEPLRVIALSIEKIIVKPIGECEKHYTLTYDGTVNGDLKAGDFKCEGLDILNPNLRILTTSQPHQVKMQIIVVAGVGFVPEDSIIDIKTLPKDKPEMIRVNANFCPVKFVNFKVLEDTPLEGMESLIMEVKTDGSVSTKSVVSMASTILIKHLRPLENLYKLDWNSDSLARENIEGVVKTELDTPIEFLDLDPQTFNMLKRDGSIALRDLRGANLRYPDKVVDTISKALKDIGLIDVERVYTGN